LCSARTSAVREASANQCRQVHNGGQFGTPQEFVLRIAGAFSFSSLLTTTPGCNANQEKGSLIVRRSLVRSSLPATVQALGDSLPVEFRRWLTQVQACPGMLTWHNDLARTGQNLHETVLTPTNVNAKTFGKVFSFPVDGQMFGQPLYVDNVAVAGKGTYNVIYVATENDSVYPFDADGVNTMPLWHNSFINPGKGVTPIPCKDTGAKVCPFASTIGITGTPVINPSSGTLYLVAATKENGKYVNRLHALDITSGVEKFGAQSRLKLR